MAGLSLRAPRERRRHAATEARLPGARSQLGWPRFRHRPDRRRQRAPAPGPSTVTIGDVNGDGTGRRRDGERQLGPEQEFGWLDSVSVLLGEGGWDTADRSSDYRLQDPNEDCRHFITMRIADVNGDRKPDLVTANIGGDWAMTVFVNGGKGTFRATSTMAEERLHEPGGRTGLGSDRARRPERGSQERTSWRARFDEVSVFVDAPGMCTVPDLTVARLRRRPGGGSPKGIARVGKIKWHKDATAGLVWPQRPERSGPPQGREGEPCSAAARGELPRAFQLAPMELRAPREQACTMKRLLILSPGRPGRRGVRRRCSGVGDHDRARGVPSRTEASSSRAPVTATATSRR